MTLESAFSLYKRLFFLSLFSLSLPKTNFCVLRSVVTHTASGILHMIPKTPKKHVLIQKHILTTAKRLVKPQKPSIHSRITCKSIPKVRFSSKYSLLRTPRCNFLGRDRLLWCFGSCMKNFGWCRDHRFM